MKNLKEVAIDLMYENFVQLNEDNKTLTVIARNLGEVEYILRLYPMIELIEQSNDISNITLVFK